jgi:predicted transcriptional regulator
MSSLSNKLKNLSFLLFLGDFLKRSKLQQYMDILGAMEGKEDGTRITKLMYASNINGTVVKKNLEIAIKMGHVEDNGDRHHREFTLSDKGARTYRGWKEYKEFFKELEKIPGLV